jgi:hypothetical protein
MAAGFDQFKQFSTCKAQGAIRTNQQQLSMIQKRNATPKSRQQVMTKVNVKEPTIFKKSRNMLAIYPLYSLPMQKQ